MTPVHEKHHNFATMKKSTIWIVVAVMSMAFMALIYMQWRYTKEFIDVRREQFDGAVRHALHKAARSVELAEMRSIVEAQLPEDVQDEWSLQDSLVMTEAVPTHLLRGSGSLIDSERDSSYQATQQLHRRLRLRYGSNRELLSAALSAILYEPSNAPLEKRVNFAVLDQRLCTELNAAGITIPYHIIVRTAGGKEVYRCADYEQPEDVITYTQILFDGEGKGQMGVLTVVFPTMSQYIFASVRFLLPAIIFTIVLFIVFIFTMYNVFRQRKLSDIKNDFINNMTHEFKTPISSISLAAQMLADSSVKKSEQMTGHLTKVIVDETKRLRFQVEKVLQMSMFDRQKTPSFKQKKLSVHELLGEVVGIFRLKVEQSGGTIETHLAATDDAVYADEMHLTNVIYNLLDNALKYREPSRPLRLTLTTDVEKSRNRLRIAIADNGIGIKSDELKKIFDRFYRVSTGNRHDVKGFGLGLAYVSGVVKAHHGQIRAESRYGEGTTFIITLPLLAEH